MSQTLLYQLALSQIPRIGPVLAKNLLGYCGSPEAVFREKFHILTKIPGIGQIVASEVVRFKDFDRLETEIAFIDKYKIQTTFFSDPGYPYRLKSNLDAPLVLFSKGATDLNAARMIGVVGTRKNSAHGRMLTEKLVSDLRSLNCCIVSGMAYGIDVIAHKTALKNDLATVGVLAHGLDRLYPAFHTDTAKKMLKQGGMLVTEFMSQTQPDRENFPKRNRIVAGLIDALVVVETKAKGGSMITADLAFQYDREVMAFPGKVGDENARGCHALIKQHKAHLIEDAGDLVRLLNYDQAQQKQKPQTVLLLDLSDSETAIMNELKQKGVLSLDAIARATGFNTGKLAQLLLQLEFSNLVRPLPGKYYELK